MVEEVLENHRMKNNAYTTFRYIGYVALVASVVFVYSRFQVLRSGVSLSLVNAYDGMTVQEPKLTLEGNAQKASRILINNKEVTIDKHGNFEESLVFSPGTNSIDILAFDRYNQITQKMVRIFVPPPQNELVNLPLPDIPETPSDEPSDEEAVLLTNDIPAIERETPITEYSLSEVTPSNESPLN